MNQRLSCSIEQKLSHNSRFENKNVNANEYENENRNWQCGVTVKTPQFDSKVAPQVKPSDAAALATSIVAECPRIVVQGLMTIGAPGDFSCFDRWLRDPT